MTDTMYIRIAVLGGFVLLTTVFGVFLLSVQIPAEATFSNHHKAGASVLSGLDVLSSEEEKKEEEKVNEESEAEKPQEEEKTEEPRPENSSLNQPVEIKSNESNGDIKTSVVGVKEIPFYSQLSDISDPTWQRLGCGIAGLAMILEFHNPGSVSSLDSLLQEGIDAGAYLPGAGWIHQGLADLAHRYGLEGRPYDFSNQSMEVAFERLKESLEKGPVIASVYYTFDTQSPIPHLAVINGVEGDTVYYNDPAEDRGGKTISTSHFKEGWKKRYITAHP